MSSCIKINMNTEYKLPMGTSVEQYGNFNVYFIVINLVQNWIGNVNNQPFGHCSWEVKLQENMNYCIIEYV